MKKIFTSLLIVFFLSVPLFATGTQETMATGPQTLKVMLAEEPNSENALVNTLQKWATETGNKIEIMVIPYEDQLSKFPLMAKNNDLPDLVSTTRLTRLYPNEFVDMTDNIDMSVFEPQALKIIGQDYASKKNVCLPHQFTITTVYYNKDAFLKAGISVPSSDNPWTLDELYKNAKTLMEKGGVKYGVAMDGSRARYDNMMYMNGGSMVASEGTSFKVTINSPQNIKTLETFISWNNDIMPKAIWAGGTTDNPADYFKNGDVGIYFSGTWNYNAFYTQISSFNWGVMPSPVGLKGSSAILGGSGLAVPSGTKHKEIAMDFLKWFYTKEHFQSYLNMDKGLSSVIGVTYAPSDKQIVQDFKVLQTEVGKVSDSYIVDENSSWRNYYDNEYRDAMKQAVNGDLTAAEALNGFATKLAKKSNWKMQY
jgi:alpha-1,4-digalacturonate transport system substrate-binding protein